MVFTKGELLDQQLKLKRSGLAPLFQGCVIVSDKTPEAYLDLCSRYGTDMEHLLMVGNSFKSDIAPVLRLGGWAVHVPFEHEWRHEMTETFDHAHLATIEQRVDLLPMLKVAR